MNRMTMILLVLAQKGAKRIRETKDDEDRRDWKIEGTPLEKHEKRNLCRRNVYASQKNARAMFLIV